MIILQKKGFTLIEIIVCITIISVITVIAIPSINYFAGVKLDADARNLVNDIRYTKLLTLLNGYQHKIIFEQNGYQIIDNTQKAVKCYKFDKNTAFECDQLSRGSSKVNYMSYNIDGTPEACGTLILAQTGGRKKVKISILPVTGRVSIKES